MNQEIKGVAMSEAEEIRELRKWLREDANRTSVMVSDLHTKIDNSIIRNNDEHKKLSEKIAEIVTKGEVNGSKIVSLASLVSLVVSGFVLAAFQALAG